MNKKFIKLTEKDVGHGPGFDIYIDPTQIAMIRHFPQDGETWVDIVDAPNWRVVESMQEIAKLLEERGIRSIPVQSKYPVHVARVVVEHISSVHYVEEDQSTSLWMSSNHLLVHEDVKTVLRLITEAESNRV